MTLVKAMEFRSMANGSSHNTTNDLTDRQRDLTDLTVDLTWALTVAAIFDLDFFEFFDFDSDLDLTVDLDRDLDVDLEDGLDEKR